MPVCLPVTLRYIPMKGNEIRGTATDLLSAIHASPCCINKALLLEAIIGLLDGFL